MAFPTIADADTKNGTVASNATNWTLTYPTNIAAGDLLVAMVAVDGSSATSTWPAGWQVLKVNSAGSAVVLHIATKKCAGTETGTFTFTTASEQGGWRIFRIPVGTWEGTEPTGVGGSLNYDSTAVSVNGSASLDPGSLDPANWGTEDTLWISALAVDTSRTISGFPSNMPGRNTSDVSGGSGGATLGVATVTSATASFDPATWAISAADDTYNDTIAIRPAAAAGNVTVTPGVKALTLATFAPVIKLGIVPDLATPTATTFAPVIKLSVVPDLATLTTTKFAPSVTASDNQLVTPGLATLATTTYAPVVRLSVVPDAASLATATFAPTVSVSDNQSVTPDTASLSTSTFAPTVTASDNQLVTPGVASLTTATFAPTVAVSDHQRVTPDTASLSLTAFAPSAVLSDNQRVTPDTATLAMTAFAPTAVISDHQLVTPDTASLTLTTFAPSVVVAPLGVYIPDTAALTLTTYAPAVSTTGGRAYAQTIIIG